MSHTKLACHIVFATKERAPMLTNELRPDMHKFIGGIIRNIKGMPIEIGGVADHVHVLAGVPPTLSVAQFIGKIKANSSRWAGIRTNGRFAWQVRYAAFSVSESDVESLRHYIRNQEEHHKTVSFKEEYIALLRLHNIEFDEEHLWN